MAICPPERQPEGEIVFMIATIRIMTTMIVGPKKYKLRKYISNIFSSYYTNLREKNPPLLLTESETVFTMLTSIL